MDLFVRALLRRTDVSEAMTQQQCDLQITYTLVMQTILKPKGNSTWVRTTRMSLTEPQSTNHKHVPSLLSCPPQMSFSQVIHCCSSTTSILTKGWGAGVSCFMSNTFVSLLWEVQQKWAGPKRIVPLSSCSQIHAETQVSQAQVEKMTRRQMSPDLQFLWSKSEIQCTPQLLLTTWTKSNFMHRTLFFFKYMYKQE